MKKMKMFKSGGFIVVVSTLPVSADRSEKTIQRHFRAAQKMAGCDLNWRPEVNGCLTWWNGPTYAYGKPYRVSAATARRFGKNCFDAVPRTEAWAGNPQRWDSPMPSFERRLQSLYSKIRYAKKYSSAIYEKIVRPKAQYGMTVVPSHIIP